MFLSRRGFVGAAVAGLLAAVGVAIDPRSAFERWCDQVDAIFSEDYDVGFAYTVETGREHWRDQFDEGCSPEDAVLSEVSYWET